MVSPELFMGITSWNSALFLPHCIQAARANTADVRTEIVVLDNLSEDGSADIARAYGANVIEERCSQADALNRLLFLSRSKYTLLMHVDTILLDPRWFDLCRKKLCKNIVLVSPQDIGCGPFTRPAGRDMPESSFMFFDTFGARDLRQTRWVRRFGLPYPAQRIDFYSGHVTHHLPQRLSERGLRWHAMKVHASNRLAEPIWQPKSCPMYWSDELSYLQYGLGNFYSLDGAVTHYHNWYERTVKSVQADGPANQCEDVLPQAYIDAYTDRFLSDFVANKVSLPDVSAPEREPKAVPRYI